jgi:7-cyano-7-deazaguanine synthase
MTSSAVVVLSGGLDSTVCMAHAASSTGRPPLALTFDYGQRARIEIERAERIASIFGSEHLVVSLDLSRWGGSALVDPSTAIPEGMPSEGQEIPSTYVPARNIVFLSVALAVAEARDLDAIYIGVNALDYSGYPDCRPEFIDAFRRVAEVGQKRGVEGRPIDIRAPLLSMSKAEIITEGIRLGAPLEETWSCYHGGSRPCGRCESCLIRRKGFEEAGVADPAVEEGSVFPR